MMHYIPQSFAASLQLLLLIDQPTSFTPVTDRFDVTFHKLYYSVFKNSGN